MVEFSGRVVMIRVVVVSWMECMGEFLIGGCVLY